MKLTESRLRQIINQEIIAETTERSLLSKMRSQQYGHEWTKLAKDIAAYNDPDDENWIMKIPRDLRLKVAMFAFDMANPFKDDFMKDLMRAGVSNFHASWILGRASSWG